MGAPIGMPNRDGGQAPQTSTGGVSAAGGTALGAAIGGMIGIGQGAINNNQNRKAQERAFRMQQALNKQGKDLALQQWKDTNALAQIKEYKKAGLNIGLMYEGGGAGGQTSAGSGGGAPSQAPTNYDLSGGAGLGIQTLMQMKMMEAQIDKTKAETENLRGADRENTVADTGLKETQIKGNELANELAGKTLGDQEEIVRHELLKIAGEGQEAQARGTQAKEIIKTELAYAVAKTKLAENGIKVGDAQIMKMAEDIAIGKFNAETARNTIGVDKVAGTALQNVVNEIMNMLGYDKDRGDQKVDDGKRK